MRISDWSSDVCSSDLVRGVLFLQIAADLPRRQPLSLDDSELHRVDLGREVALDAGFGLSDRCLHMLRLVGDAARGLGITRHRGEQGGGRRNSQSQNFPDHYFVPFTAPKISFSPLSSSCTRKYQRSEEHTS